MIRIEIAAVCVLLAACAAVQKVDQGTSVVTNTVSIPYPVPCLVKKKLPDLPARTPIDPGPATSTEQLAAAYAADVEAFEAYAKAADELLRECVRSIAKGDKDVTTRPLHQ